MSETWQQRYWGQVGRQAGTMLKGVCSRAHKLTLFTEVCWHNTGVNTEHLKITVQAEDRSPPLKRWFNWPTQPEPEAQRWSPRASNCSDVPRSSLKTCLWKPTQKKNKNKKTENPKRLKETNKQESNIVTGIRIGGKTFFLSSRIKVYMKISHASC